MSWHKTAAVVTAMMVPVVVADTGAIAAQLTSPSGTDAPWLATQLHQAYFSSRSEQSSDQLPYHRANGSSMPDGPHRNGSHPDPRPYRWLPLVDGYPETNQ